MSDAVHDVVIVGAGPGGCVLADRLSADGRTRVLLIEAGDAPRGLRFRVPTLSSTLWGDPRCTWMLRSEPEAALDGRRLPIPAGRVLGGGTAINGMTMNRGLPTDYEAFARMGLVDWGYRELLPYFLRSESNWRGAGPLHSADGPFRLEPARRSPIADDALAAARAVGFPITDDFAGAHPAGFGVPDVDIVRGRRRGAYEAYLRPAMRRPNLRVLTNAVVTRILVEDGRAAGVDLVREGRVERHRADREVVVAAGAFRTPHLLMHSGIGDPDELARHGIDVTAERREVGRGLVDQPAVGIEIECRPHLSFDHELRWDRLAGSAIRWATTGRGPFSSMPMVVTGVARTGPGEGDPDTRFMLGGAADSRPWRPGARTRRGDVLVANAAVAHPRSTGRVRLASSDPADAPLVSYGLLSDPEDVADLARGYRALVAMLERPELRRHLGDIVRPAAAPRTRRELTAFLRASASTTQHPLATCRMGVDEESVVDPELRVRGVEGLRIADASVLPRQIAGNPTAVLVMLGEKAADLVAGRAAPDPVHAGADAISACRLAQAPADLPDLPDVDGAAPVVDASWETQTGW